MAYVTLSEAGLLRRNGQQQVLDEIAQFVDNKVSSYKRLRGGIQVLDEIPKTASGKVLRRLLPARLALARPAKL